MLRTTGEAAAHLVVGQSFDVAPPAFSVGGGGSKEESREGKCGGERCEGEAVVFHGVTLLKFITFARTICPPRRSCQASRRSPERQSNRNTGGQFSKSNSRVHRWPLHRNAAL